MYNQWQPWLTFLIYSMYWFFEFFTNTFFRKEGSKRTTYNYIYFFTLYGACEVQQLVVSCNIIFQLTIIIYSHAKLKKQKHYHL